MNPYTGAIANFESDDDATAAGHTVPLTPVEVAHLAAVPRKHRTTALDRLRALGPHSLAALDGMTEDDVRKLRNAAKRERRARRG